MGDPTGRQERREARKERREAESELDVARQKEITKKKQLDSERVRLLRSRSRRTLFDVIDSTTGEGQAKTGRSSLLG